MPDPKVITKPTSDGAVPKPPLPEPIIRTMPEKYIGASAGKAPIVREVVETRIKEVAPPLPPKPAAAVPPKKSKRALIIAGVAAVLLIGMGVAAYILLVPAKPTPAPAPIKNVNVPVNQNANANANANVPAKPVCGNGAVESGEQCDIGSQNGVAGSGCTAGCMLVTVTPEVPNTGTDSDSDGLTDVEETEIYGSDPMKTDTDGDSFNDGNEVAHLYDPMKKAPAMLEDSSVMKRVENKAQGYSVLVPAKWAVSGEGAPTLIVTAPDSEFFQAIASTKAKDQSLVEWYLAMSPGSKAADVERFKTEQGYDALRSPDRLTTYIDAGDGRVYTLSYSFDSQPKLQFRTTYDVLVGSFKLLKP